MLQLHEPLCLANLDQHMVPIEGATFEMGGEGYRAKPIHAVQLDDFFLCRYPVSQQLWYEVMGKNPEELRFENQHRPVERISWDDINDHFLPALREKAGDDSYCLPTEAQWEYAARGRKWSAARQEKEIHAFEYTGSDNLKEVGWYIGNSHSETNLLGCKRPNALGLYDMSGNVREWCQDWFDRDYYQTLKDKYGDAPAINPKGPGSGTSRVVRGGSWLFSSLSCRVSDRYFFNPNNRLVNVGFRLCRYLPR